MENENNVINSESNEVSVNEDKRKSGLSAKIVIGIVLFAIAIGVVIMVLMFSPQAKYKKANNLINSKKYDEAISMYKELGDYKDSKDKIILCNYEKALILIEEDNYMDAKSILLELDSYEKTEDKLRICNHMIMYNYILENGTAYKGSYLLDNPDTGLSLQVKDDDTTIRCWYEYYIDESVLMSTAFIISLDTNNIEVSYFLELGEMNAQGDGIFYPHLYDGNLDNTTGEVPEDKMAISSQEKEVTIWIDDVNYSPYLELDFYNGDSEVMDELAALQYYCDFEYILTTLSNHIEYLDCGVSIADFGINME